MCVSRSVVCLRVLLPCSCLLRPFRWPTCGQQVCNLSLIASCTRAGGTHKRALRLLSAPEPGCAGWTCRLHTPHTVLAASEASSSTLPSVSPASQRDDFLQGRPLPPLNRGNFRGVNSFDGAQWDLGGKKSHQLEDNIGASSTSGHWGALLQSNKRQRWRAIS